MDGIFCLHVTVGLVFSDMLHPTARQDRMSALAASAVVGRWLVRLQLTVENRHQQHWRLRVLTLCRHHFPASPEAGWRGAPQARTATSQAQHHRAVYCGTLITTLRVCAVPQGPLRGYPTSVWQDGMSMTATAEKLQYKSCWSLLAES